MPTEMLETGALVTVVLTLSKVIDHMAGKMLRGTGNGNGNGHKPESPAAAVSAGRLETSPLPPWYERLARLEARADAQDTRFHDIIDRLDTLHEKLDHLLISRTRD